MAIFINKLVQVLKIYVLPGKIANILLKFAYTLHHCVNLFNT